MVKQPADTDIQIKHVLDRVPGMVVVYNIQTGVYKYVNSSVKQLLGYSPKEFLSGGLSFVASLVHPDDLKAIMADNQKALAKANKARKAKHDDSPIATFEYRMKHKDGTYRWLHTDGVVYDRDDKGNVLHVMNISIDITARRERELREANTRKQFEQKLLQSERHYRSLIENSFEAVIVADKDGKFTYVSPSTKGILGYTPKELIGKSTSSLFPAETRDEEMKKFSSIANNPGGTIKVVTQYVTKRGKVLTIESTVSNLLNDPFVQGYVSNFRDITNQRIAEERKHHLAAIVASSDDAIVSKTLDGIITTWNKAAHKIFGYTAKEAIGKHISLIIPPNLLQEEANIIATLKRGGHIDHFETVRRRKNGKMIFVSLSISPIKDESGKIIGASKIARDITEQKKTEQAIKQSEERLQLAVDAGNIGIWDWNIVDNHIIWSDRVYEIHEVRKGTKVGELEKYQRRHHPDDAKRVQKAIQDALNGIKPYREEFRIITPAGKIKWVETKAIVIRENNQPIRMLGATTDVTARKNLEQQKDEFIGIASHELKTPVTSIKAYAQLLETQFRRDGLEKPALMLMKINSQLNKLTGLISDLLDVTKIETGKLEFHEEYFDFNELVKEIVDEIQPTTAKHKLIMKFDKSKSIYGDRDRIGQVLTNLLTNAVKYSPQASEIHITTKLTKETISVSVRDFGIGIPPKIKDHVFERFFRVSTPSGLTFPGMGLGLYISRQIVERQDGKIWVESQKDKGRQGSTFSFSLPINRKPKKNGVK